MKKLLLTLVACFVAIAANAQYSSWYVNVIGTFNGWGTNGIQPGSGTTTTHKNLPIGTSEFRIKCWDGSADINYSTGGTVQVGVPTKLTKGNANSMTISGATNGETFNVEFNIATETMTITRPGEDQVIDWYVCGDFQGTNWDPGDANYKFTKQSDGSYKSPTISKLTNFLITQGDWASKYGGNGSDVTVGTPYTLVLNGQDLTMGDGKYVQNAVITINNENKMTVSGTLIDEGAKYYLVGDEIGWSPSSTYEFQPTSGGNYELITNVLANTGYKITTGTTYYTYNDAAIPAAGGEFSLYTGGTNNNMWFASSMSNVTLTFNPAESKLIVTPSDEPVPVPEEFYIMGNVNGNDWSPNKNVPMQNSDGVFTATNIIVTNADNGYGYVGFATQKTDLGSNEGGWDNLGTRYGAASENEMPTFGQPSDMVPNGSNYSFKLKEGLYDVIVIFDEKGQPSVIFTQTEPDMSLTTATVDNITVDSADLNYAFTTNVGPNDLATYSIKVSDEDNVLAEENVTATSGVISLADLTSGTSYNVTVTLTATIGTQTFTDSKSVTFETEAESSFPEKLYLSIGTGTMQNSITFKPDTDQTLEQTSDGVYTASNIDITAQKAFIFYSGTTAAPVKYAPSAWRMIYLTDEEYYWPLESEESDGAFVEGGTWCWVIYTTPSTGDGTYNVTVDLNTMMFKLEANLVEPEPVIPEKLQIALGSSTTFGSITRNPDTDLVFESTESGVFVVKDVPLVRYGAFVFYGNGDVDNVYTPSSVINLKFGTYTEWPNAGVTNADNKFAEGGDNTWYVGTVPTGITNPQYDITVDFNSMTISLVAHAPAVVEPEPFYFMGYNEDGDQVPIKEKMTPSSTDPNVYEFTYNVPNYKDGFKFYFSSTGKVAQTDNFVPAIANELIKFGDDKKYKATWSNTGTGQAIDRVAGETVFRFNVETLECEVEYAGNFVNFEFTGVENAYYYVNMANLTGDDMVVYLNSNSVQYGIDKSGLTQLVASPKDGYTLEITCPEAQSTSTYMITPGGQGDEQVISLYSGAQGYTFTFTVSEKVEAEPVYVLSGPIFLGKTETMEMTLDGTTATALAVCWPQIFTIQKKVDDKVVETYGGGVGITSFGEYQGSEGGSNWTLSDLVVNGTGSPIAFSFDTETLVLTVSTGVTADTGSDKTEQSGSVTDNQNINIVSENPAVLVFLNVPEEASAVYYKVNYNQPAGKNAHRVAPDGYVEAEKYEGDGPDNGRYAVSLLTGTSGTLDVIYELDGAQSKAQTYNFTVTMDVPTGVDGIAADEEGAEYYSLDGVKVKNPEKGIYIRVKNGEVTKVVK